jgi:hypothetical protein
VKTRLVAAGRRAISSSSAADGQPSGNLQLARALRDRDLSDQLLARGVETVLKLLDDRE